MNKNVKEQVREDVLRALPAIVKALIERARKGEIEAVRELRLLVIEPLITKPQGKARTPLPLPGSVLRALTWVQGRERESLLPAAPQPVDITAESVPDDTSAERSTDD